MSAGKNKLIITAVIITVLYAILALSVRADEAVYNDYDADMGELYGSASDDAREIIDTDVLDSFDYTQSFNGIVSAFITRAVKAFAGSVTVLSGVIVLSTLISKIADFSEGRISQGTLDLIQTFLIAVFCYTKLSDIFEEVQLFVQNVGSLMSSYGIVMGEIYLFGGNISRAAVNNAWLALSIEISSRLCQSVLLPVLKISFAAVIASSVSSTEHLKGISTYLKSFYVWISVFAMTVLTVIMSFQSVLAGAGDSVALRSVKFATSNTIPIIGGLVSESLRTLSGALAIMKSESGMICTVLVIGTSVIPLSYVMGVKYTLSVGSVLSSFIGNDKIRSILGECSSLINYLIGLIVTVTVYYIYFISVFVNSSSVLGS